MRKWREVVRLGCLLVVCGCAGEIGSEPSLKLDDDLPLDGDPLAMEQPDGDGGASAGDAALDASTADASDARVEVDAAADAAVDAEADAAASSDAGVESDAGCAALTYESVGKPFVDSYCIRCHGASSRSLSLDTLDKLQSNVARIELAVVTNRTMPKGTTLPADDARARFGAFLACLPH